MSDFWKVAGIFIGTLGAAAIIFQLNKGKVLSSGTSAFTTAIGDAFTSAPAQTSSTKSYHKTG